MNFAEISMRLFMELVVGLSRYEAPVWLLVELILLLRCRLFIAPARLISRLACFLAATRDL